MQLRFPLCVFQKAVALGLMAGVLGLLPACRAEVDLSKIDLPDGFTIEYFAEDVPNARSMTLGENGTLFIGTRELDCVYAIPYATKSAKASCVVTIDTGLDMPNGVAFRDGALYVAENSRILRYDDIENRLYYPSDPGVVNVGCSGAPSHRQLTNLPEPTVVSADFPADEHHGWKFIAFGPDGLLYVPVGAPCNICLREDNPQYASITRMKPDGSDHEVFAQGVRNTVGFDWNPATKELWFTENGRDWLGDDIPPDELNKAPQAGLHFGYPFCHGGDIQDPEINSRTCDEFVKPEQNLDPHVAALGMRFYTGAMFPEEYRNQIFIAEHGSWNRSAKIGYRIMLVRLDESGKVISYEPFATGWLQGDTVSGRPVDVQVMPDGSMLVSDDEAGAIYRISYKEN